MGESRLDGKRTCEKCLEVKPLNFDFFDRNIVKSGVTYRKICKVCRQKKRIELHRANGILEAKRPIDKDGMRKCHDCKIYKKICDENFSRHHRGKNHKGVCKDCMNKRSAERGKIPRNRAVVRLCGYRKHDKARGRECSITLEDLLSLSPRPCTYCGVIGDSGADRIDNSIGHTIDNVVPCCTDCNITRGDRYSHEEMKIIGKAIAEALRLRS